MRIHKSGKNYFSGAIYLAKQLRVFLDPRIADRCFGGSYRYDFPTDAKHCPICDDSQFAQFRSAPRTGTAGRRPQSKQLANVVEKDWCDGTRSACGFQGVCRNACRGRGLGIIQPRLEDRVLVSARALAQKSTAVQYGFENRVGVDQKDWPRDGPH
jgi:hypothetical protein